MSCDRLWDHDKLHFVIEIPLSEQEEMCLPMPDCRPVYDSAVSKVIVSQEFTTTKVKGYSGHWELEDLEAFLILPNL